MIVIELKLSSLVFLKLVFTVHFILDEHVLLIEVSLPSCFFFQKVLNCERISLTWFRKVLMWCNYSGDRL